MTDAWAQVVDCRRMLKWTYAFGYYRYADQTAASKPQQEFFEFNQVGEILLGCLLSLSVQLPTPISNLMCIAHWQLVCIYSLMSAYRHSTDSMYMQFVLATQSYSAVKALVSVSVNQVLSGVVLLVCLL